VKDTDLLEAGVGRVGQDKLHALRVVSRLGARVYSYAVKTLPHFPDMAIRLSSLCSDRQGFHNKRFEQQ
jgi:hypothetical protein